MAFCMHCGTHNPTLPDDWENWQCSLCESDETRTCTKFYENQKGLDIDPPSSFYSQLQDGLEILDPDGDHNNEYDGWRDDDSL